LRFQFTAQQKRGTACASSEMKVLGKPDSKKRDTAPRIHVEAVLLSCYYQPCFWKFPRFSSRKFGA